MTAHPTLHVLLLVASLSLHPGLWSSSTDATAAPGTGAAVAEPVTKIDAVLAREIADQGPAEEVPIIVLLAERADLAQLGDAIVNAGLERRQRAEVVIAALKEVAATAQPALRERLRVLETAGRVSDVHPFWMINAIALRAVPAAVEEIAARADVKRVFLDGLLELERPEEESPASAQPGQAEVGLRAVGAPSLWALGYTGAGTIVMNIDTGVHGNHAALAARWLGNEPGVPAADAWFDPFQQACTTPCDYGTHGTHTMGIMTGLDPATQDTTGVAFGANWIAAATVAVGQSPHTSISIAAFEWAVDPGGPFSSRPPADVISCSWADSGVNQSGDCGPNGTYWEVIDAFEAIGGAVVFSCGNSGPGSQTITRPKNRISSPVNVWATGNVDANQAGFPIRYSSSRGPSDCDGVTPKPEAVAPGTSVRAPVPTGYGFKTGTSMASPHVAGVIALLMEAVPWATGTDIKLALIATATDLGTPGEDNTYGNGLIDARAAFEFLWQAAALRENATRSSPTSMSAASLRQNVPNPFNPSTSISFELLESSIVNLKVYDYHGRVVATLVEDGRQSAGTHTVRWDGTMTNGGRAPSGMYAVRLAARPESGVSQETDGAETIRMRKAILLR